MWCINSEHIPELPCKQGRPLWQTACHEYGHSQTGLPWALGPQSLGKWKCAYMPGHCWVSGAILKDRLEDSQKPGDHSRGVCSRGPLHHMYNLHKETLAIDHQWPEFDHWQVLSSSYAKWLAMRLVRWCKTHSVLAQSSPAGHKSAPVHSWLKLWPALMLRGMWGLSDWPLGVIQSMIALFIPLVLSALTPFAPFWICQ